ncbi:MAG: L-threonylcarbamoyladenylate synthase [Bacteroidetes bacterium]|nr:L-threonylcarbamoyladenylate synthase [Bacteroidota bacterium]
MNSEIHDEIKKCLEVLNRGGIILYPTDTVWGIGCDASNEKAISKIYDLKKRDDSKSMIILLDQEARLQSYVEEVPSVAWDLIECADKPITIIYDKAKNVAQNLIAEDGSLGIRVTKDEFCKMLIHKFRKPVVSTSANISGNKPPASFSEIDEAIINGVDYVVNLRQNERMKSSPSTIIKLGRNGEFKMIRK